MSKFVLALALVLPTCSDAVEHADGVAFDPVLSRWKPLPSSPLTGRSSPAAVWTGSEVIFWGGRAVEGTRSDGAWGFRP